MRSMETTEQTMTPCVLPPSKVLVTGATGFLGAHVARELSQLGYVPVVGFRQGANRAKLLDIPRLEWQELDLQSSSSIKQIAQRTDITAVIHCAAYGVDSRQQDMETAIAVNVTAVGQLIDVAAEAGIKRFVHCGTGYEYGAYSGPATENHPLQPTTLYGSTKAAGSLLALQRSRCCGLPLCVVRPFSLFGPGEGDHKIVPMVMRACRTRTRLALSAGEQVRDYLFVRDAVGAMTSLLTTEVFPNGEIFNLASDRPVTLKEFITRCANLLGGEDLLDFGVRPYRAQEPMFLVGDSGRWTRRFGSTVHQTDLEQGFQEMLHSYEGLVA